jgi:hypothetical protein
VNVILWGLMAVAIVLFGIVAYIRGWWSGYENGWRDGRRPRT